MGNPKPLLLESDYQVIVSDDKISCIYPNGKIQTVHWSSLKSVVIRTSEKGPWHTDVFWVLKDHEGKSQCIIPLGAKGETHLLDRLQTLPAFDDEAFIEAMGSTRNKKFICWSSKASHA